MSLVKTPWALSLALVVCAVACSPPPSPDVEEVDGTATDTAADRATDISQRPEVGPDGESPDVLPMDAQGDAAADATIDATDGAVILDARPTDAGNDSRDAASPSDVPIIVEPDVVRVAICDQPSTLRICTMDSECRAGAERCLPSGCGTTRRCQPAGRPCVDNGDCLFGTQQCSAGVCVQTGSDCGDTRACPLGFSCEGTAGTRRCVSHRRACEQTYNPCPYGDLCHEIPGLNPFCIGVATRCGTNDTCIIGSSCLDVDGDGLRECVPSGPCTNASCGLPGRCEIRPVDYFLFCGPRGICSPATGCGPGYDCVDAWGSDVYQCRARTDVCQTNAQCPVDQVCFEPDGAAMPGSPSGCR
ncbi:MAG: hypothetical protein Q8Q09_09325 [Deltaproteobacteria bacterium]|nr:hypothetical protein [Deltaproteobacteria bacterium]